MEPLHTRTESTHCLAHPRADRPVVAAAPAAPAAPAPFDPSARPFTAAEFERLVHGHLPAMERAARAILRKSDLAADAVQDVLLRLWQRGYLPEDPRGALCHLASLAALQELRGRRRRERREGEACAAPMHRAESSDPAEEAERAEERSAIAAALLRLPPEQRLVFRLFELEGHDYACIAEQTGVPLGTVRSRLNRARAALRSQLNAAFGEKSGAA